MNLSPYVFKIQRYAVHDGPGIRTTLFFQGCPLSCPWCHNPESQAMPPVLLDEGEIDGMVRALIVEIEKDRIFYEDSGGGVTFSGGEPLCQPRLLSGILDACREKEIHTCLDTSGFADADLFRSAARKTDLVLYDVKLIRDRDHVAMTGKSARPVLRNLEQLWADRVSARLRYPLIPGMTDAGENIDGWISFLKGRTGYRDIHILPFHRAGEGKYAALNLNNRMKGIQPPSSERVAETARLFESAGFHVTIGG